MSIYNNAEISKLKTIVIIHTSEKVAIKVMHHEKFYYFTAVEVP
jgi:hypothetical protein